MILKKTTTIIDNWSGALVRDNIGKMNSGKAKIATTFGNNPFSNPGNLTWFEQPTSILSLGLSNGPMTGIKSRNEGTIEYVYGVTSDDFKLYKIQVNNTSTKNPNYDTPSVIATLSNSPTFRYGPGIQFYGSDNTSSVLSKVYIGADNGIVKTNADGNGNTLLGTVGVGSIIANVPRPLANFVGKIYFGNGNNIGEIDSTETITSNAKLSPGFPVGTYVRDLDVTPDGNYLQITVSQINQIKLDAQFQDSTSLGSTDSYKYYWNGTDTTYTSFETYGGYSLTANNAFANRSYTLGYDLGGTAVYNGTTRELTLPNSVSPNFGTVFSTGNLLGFAAPEYNTSSSVLQGSLYFYGKYDQEIADGLFRALRINSATKTDIATMPACAIISNLSYTPSVFGYTNNINGSAKLYFTTSETDQSGTVSHLVYKFTTVTTGVGSVIGGVYETQNELFSRKVKPTEVRLYTQPLVANNSFTLDLIGSGNSPVAGGSKTFTVGQGSIVAGQDFVWYTPQTAPGHNWGARITNVGSVNWVGVKMEIDFVEAGK